jgi:hypothetical protein
VTTEENKAYNLAISRVVRYLSECAARLGNGDYLENRIDGREYLYDIAGMVERMKVTY